jgi:phage repressor protein C with HTH and peptisase S24 domain
LPTSIAYALEISGKSMEPVYRDDTLIVVSPAGSISRGDRVVKTRRGEVMVKEIKRRTGKSIELRSVDRERKEQTLPVREVLWMHRYGR